MTNEWMNAAQAAASLHITRATLYKLIRDGRLPARRVHGRWMFQPREIEALFSSSSAHDAAGRGPAQ
jgi:excisionase family DNA binding protein